MRRSLIFNLITILSMSILTSCGGGGSAGIGGTGITSGGTITGFGSIFVNGVEYDTDNASVAGDLSQVAELRLGMVVIVRGQLNADGISGTADSIDVDIELEGPVAATPVEDTNANTKTFTVLGRTVIASDGTTVFDGSGFTFASITQNDVVEISGYLDADANLRATRIEKKGTLNLGSTSVEVNGIVGQVSSGSFTLLVDNTTFTINDNGLTVPGGIISGIELEVEGILNNSNEISATDIKLDDDLFDNNDAEIEIEGYISNYVDNSNFVVNGQRVDATNATLSPSNLALADNVKVEIEGNLSNAVLVASEVEGRNSEIRIDSNVSAVDTTNGEITLTFAGQTITIKVDNQTKLEDDISSNPLTLAAINTGDFVEIKAYDNNGDIIATDLKRENDEADGKAKLRGTVTAIDNGTVGQESITVLGINYPTDAMTDFEIDDVASTRTQFLNALNIGDTVAITDEKVNFIIDGIADEMDLKN